MPTKNLSSAKRSQEWDYSMPSKKLIIRNYKGLQDSSGYYDKCWCYLEEAINSILKPNETSNFNHISLENLYSYVHNLCLAKKSSLTYSQLREQIQNYIRQTLLSKQFAEFEEWTDNQYLSKLEVCWNCFCIQMKMIRNIFLHLDRTYVLQNAKINSIWDLSLELFREILILDKSIYPKLIQSLLNLIARDRENESQRLHRSLIRNILRMLHDLNIYERFETEFLKESQQYFRTQGSHNIQLVGTMTIEILMKYLDFIDFKLNEESERLIAFQIEAYHTSKKLVNIIEKELIDSHLDSILTNKVFAKLLDDPNLNKYNRLVYELLNQVPTGATRLCIAFNQFIKFKGRTMVQVACSDQEREKTLIQDLIDFKDRMDKLVQDCYSANERFINSLKEAFENFINICTNKMAELIAKYVDDKLRQVKEDDGFDNLLDKVMVMFRFIHGKDIFEAFYQRDLSKRLLGGKSASNDAEKLMLLKLKQECGGAFTSKLESMFKDIELSKELTASFDKYLKSEKAVIDHKLSRDFDMNVFVLTTGIWPSTKSPQLLLTDELQHYQTIFTNFYLTKHQGRKLTWQDSFGHCVVKASYDKFDKDFQVSFIQTLVLLQFMQNDERSLKDIRNAVLTKDPSSDTVKTSDENELRRTLQSLACGKVRVLSKRPKGRDIEDDDSFVFNHDFQHKLMRIKINQVQWKESFEENVATQVRVTQDRQYQLDAALVRIMKSRKTMEHSALVTDVYDKINFPVASQELKKRIESLIERDYLKREKDDLNMYHYVA
ncbi:hypothetical protein RDWZM_000379 [Blomia tropicalis]|uniref:Cullin family profile domain-containing protein n=1 Tax=Blomia tropicalis TaxID=40697 RepID=A0A9Q0MA85_BLOTA|nr:Cullin-4A [Blomia tropicalis]KAJ6221834.1 hypothetical protein RDWZM_000379 [Blomia tropicalis]